MSKNLATDEKKDEEKYGEQTWKDSTIINAGDLRKLIDKDITSIHNKIKEFGKTIGTKTHNIECSLYDNVYIFSDIHADFVKFCQILIEYNLITIADETLTKINETYPTLSTSLNLWITKLLSTNIPLDGKTQIMNALYPSPDIEENKPTMYGIWFDIIENIKWIGGEKTLIILVGDLVDGKRGEGEVYDPYGIFELLIHSLIHNIRIKSRENKSDMLFTFGNHDFFGCFCDNFAYENYIHTSCKKYYGLDYNNKRLSFLQPFYINSPFLFLNLQYNEETKIKCIHAGIHSENGLRYPDENLGIAQQILNDITFENIKNTDMTEIINPAEIVLYDRPYYNNNKQKKDGCEYIKEEEPLIIIGHCPTAAATKTQLTNLNLPEYAHCDYLIEEIDESDNKKLNDYITFKNNPQTKGCVVVGCKHDNHSPKLIYVDSALSNSFRVHFYYQDRLNTKEANRITNDINKTRHVEILKLTRDTSIYPDARYYYNIFERLNSGEGNHITIYETPHDPFNSIKGGKKTNRKYKKNLKKSKKQTKRRNKKSKK
jgi:hypothetical protein